VVAAAITALALGAALGLELNGLRQDVGAEPQSPTASPSPSEAAVATPTQPPIGTASPSPALTSNPSAGAPSAAPETATPIPTVEMLTGTWQRLPENPDSDGLRVADAILLADGRIAVMHARRLDRHGDCVVVFEPQAQIWKVPRITAPDEYWDGCLNSNQTFSPHPDGRLYSIPWAIDPRTTPWHVQRAPLSDQLDFNDSMGTTTNGDLYAPTGWCSTTCETRLYQLNAETGTRIHVATRKRGGSWVVSGSASRLFIGGHSEPYVSSPLTSYDPITGEWRDELPVPIYAAWDMSALGPDGWIYVRVFDQAAPALWARQPDTGEWYEVQLPPDLRAGWYPAMVDGGDGRLYLFDVEQPYAFSPSGVAPVPTP